MYAVIKTGGKQYRVQPGDMLVVEKLEGEPGAVVAFDQVLMMGGAEGVSIGAPLVEGALVHATLIETRKGQKIKVFKKIRRQGYRRTQGHRQAETVLRVTGLEGAGQSMKWDGTIDLTTRAEINARARGLAAHPVAVEAPVPVMEAKAPKAKAVKPVDAEVEVPAAVEATMAESAPAAAAPEADVAEAAPKPKRAKKAAAPAADDSSAS